MEYKIKEIFELLDGSTALSVAMDSSVFLKIPAAVLLKALGESDQYLNLIGEQKFVGRSYKLHERVFTTQDRVLLSKEQVRSGNWKIVFVE
jgi:hypothetical protein